MHINEVFFLGEGGAFKLLINHITAPIVKTTRCTGFINVFILSNIVHVSDGLSVHHQELKTVHTATGICQTATVTCC